MINLPRYKNSNSKNLGLEGNSLTATLNEQKFPFDGLWYNAIEELESNLSFITDIHQHNAEEQNAEIFVKSLNSNKRQIKTITYSEKDYKPQIELQTEYLTYLEAVLSAEKTMSIMLQEAKNRASDETQKKISSYCLNNNFTPQYGRERAYFYDNKDSEAARKTIYLLIQSRALDLNSLQKEGQISEIIYFKFLIDKLEKFTMFFSLNANKIESKMLASVEDLYQNKIKMNPMSQFIYYDMHNVIAIIQKNMKSTHRLGMIGAEYADKLKNISEFYDEWHKEKMKPIEAFVKIKDELKNLDLNKPDIVKEFLTEHAEKIKNAITYSKTQDVAWYVNEFTEVFEEILDEMKTIAKSNLKNGAVVRESGILGEAASVAFLLHYNRARIHEVIHNADSYWAAEILKADDEAKSKLARAYISSNLVGAIKDKKMDLKIKIIDVPGKMKEATPTLRCASAIAFIKDLERLQNTKNNLTLDILHDLFPFIARELGVKEYKLEAGNKDKNYIQSEYAKTLKQFVGASKKNSLTDRALASIEKSNLNINIAPVHPVNESKKQIKHKV